MASKILFSEIVNILKKTKNSPNQPKITAIDNKLEPRSRCSKFCMYFFINRCNSTWKSYLFKNKKAKVTLFKIYVVRIFNLNNL